MKIKKLLIPLLSLSVILTVVAFTIPKKASVANNARHSTRVLDYYFAYIGPSAPPLFSAYVNQNNYVLLNDDPYSYCITGSDEICVVICPRIWNGTSWKPDFSDTTSIANAHDQLFDFWAYGLQGSRLFLKTLNP